jgi:hypothetical protein
MQRFQLKTQRFKQTLKSLLGMKPKTQSEMKIGKKASPKAKKRTKSTLKLKGS